ncbi:TolC family protein [Sphingomonas sp. PAMC 26621]|uniref:TolC family protein n=1 Tax=Sphingomonas sp. PAMC 26621 TaxID=1112213 RepID=UPI000287A706|nr:TolC family protein [Sphingomonas sp. PAMC 26621]
MSMRSRILLGLIAGAASLTLPPSSKAAVPDGRTLPSPVSDPMSRILAAEDPILKLDDTSYDVGGFRGLVAAAVRRHPAIAEAQAGSKEARAARSEAKAQLLPRVDLSFSSYRVASRAFSNDPQNIIERSRADRRTDALASIDQTFFDFGATRARIESANERFDASTADVDNVQTEVALRAIAAWYNVFAYRELVGLSQGLTDHQVALRKSILKRVSSGATASGDVARVDSYLASARTHVAIYQRSLAAAEAQFTEIYGRPPPNDLLPAPPLGRKLASSDAAAAAVVHSPTVKAAAAVARAAHLQARAAHADTLPTITGGVDAGRYGVFETARDYDVRARVAVRWRLFGGVGARADQADARADAADARTARTAEELRRDAVIAWTDVGALDRQLVALRQSYLASRQSRDVLAERFAYSRGTLFDVLESEDSYFQTAAAFVQALAERDATRYVLLARTGLLLDALAIPQYNQETTR